MAKWATLPIGGVSVMGRSVAGAPGERRDRWRGHGLGRPRPGQGQPGQDLLDLLVPIGPIVRAGAEVALDGDAGCTARLDERAVVADQLVLRAAAGVEGGQR